MTVKRSKGVRLNPLEYLYYCSLTICFCCCFAIVLLSWPDRHDRKVAAGPKPAGCCDVEVATMLAVSPAARAAERGGVTDLAAPRPSPEPGPARGGIVEVSIR